MHVTPANSSISEHTHHRQPHLPRPAQRRCTCLKQSTDTPTLAVDSHLASCDLFFLTSFFSTVHTNRPPPPPLDSLCSDEFIASSLIHFHCLPIVYTSTFKSATFLPFFKRRHNAPPTTRQHRSTPHSIDIMEKFVLEFKKLQEGNTN
ncbi:hypothetical protein Salat_0442800 [Sesamum alatum]|uniref:Uncharacterized protein n=1 Tax=Sesamum alatum TaxID=300844 RepID=A0AAE2D0S9_9LAMI|nr:hypothetical protein Salat_0442800 [Sesamum alatum]